VKLYTALYHALIHPGIISDANGEFPEMGRRRIGRYADRNRYSVFSLWDTYRTLHPLLTLLYPEKQTEIVRTMLDMYRESGWLPKWELAGNETYMMVGDPAVPVIADSYIKGLRGYDTLLAYEAITKSSSQFTPESEAARPGYDECMKLQFIPVDQDTTRQWWVWGPVSTMLEYCLADWTIARYADRLGRTADAREYDRRALFYRTLFDSSTGFLRPRRRDGRWLHPFDPLATEGSGSWPGSGGPGYVEGNAWNYTWFVPHDMGGLVRLFGSERAFLTKLEILFSNGQFTINNEPDIGFPYIFTRFPGQEHRAIALVRSLRDTAFGTGPGGLPGNDDAGTISAWFVFSALGLYPDCVGSGEYRLTEPLFDRAVLDPPGRSGDTGRIVLQRTTGSRRGDEEIPEYRWNGRKLSQPSISHREIIRGGTLEFRSSPE
jgi:predicted alpha-1,2-mannosidase